LVQGAAHLPAPLSPGRHHDRAQRLNSEVATRRADDLAGEASAQSLGRHSLLNRLDEAVSWYEGSLEPNAGLGLENRVARTHMNLGAIYSDSGQLEQAVRHLQRGLGLELAEEIGDQLTIARVLQGIPGPLQAPGRSGAGAGRRM
jgi:tetratricopeptide (TPR) repeat protein